MDDPRAALSAILQAHIDMHRKLPTPAGWRYRCLEELVVDLGTWHTPSVLRQPGDRGPERMCYSNAFSHASRHGLFYVEGFALSGELMFQHAWCVDDAGLVQDPTWPDHAGRAYCGVAFTPDWLAGRDGGEPVLFASHGQNYHRLLREGLPARAVAAIEQPRHPQVS